TLHLERQAVDLVQFLQRSADAHRDRFQDQHIALDYQVLSSDIQIVVDLDRMTQVMNNLLGNALRYVPAGGTVVLRAALEDHGVVISVIDNGPGVAPEDVQHLFERFWRGDPSRSRETGGSGLGLTIARRIIEAHNGRIWAETSPGGGLTLNIWLPTA
ncbi:MAG: ATP-binding protein, partial [Anaerolineae bacterium]|nr:ATP-binding protein [Anaerolineae bacterium]